MSEPTRADLRVRRYVSDGGMAVPPPTIDTLTDEELDRIAEQWARENPSKALSAALTETCETCGGEGDSPWCQLCKEVHRIVPPYIGCAVGDLPCPDCGGTGKKLRDGVKDMDEGEERFFMQSMLAFPASWLEGADDE